MTPERIVELRKRYDGRIYGGQTETDVRDLLDALESAQKEIADLKRGGVVVPELTAADLFGSIGQIPAKATWGEIVGAINGFVQNRLRTIPADRELGEGQVAVDRELIEEIGEHLESAVMRLGVCGHGDGADRKADGDSYGATDALNRLRDALRANQGEAER